MKRAYERGDDNNEDKDEEQEQSQEPMSSTYQLSVNSACLVLGVLASGQGISVNSYIIWPTTLDVIPLPGTALLSFMTPSEQDGKAVIDQLNTLIYRELETVGYKETKMFEDGAYLVRPPLSMETYDMTFTVRGYAETRDRWLTLSDVTPGLVDYSKLTKDQGSSVCKDTKWVIPQKYVVVTMEARHHVAFAIAYRLLCHASRTTGCIVAYGKQRSVMVNKDYLKKNTSWKELFFYKYTVPIKQYHAMILGDKTKSPQQVTLASAAGKNIFICCLYDDIVNKGIRWTASGKRPGAHVYSAYESTDLTINHVSLEDITKKLFDMNNQNTMDDIGGGGDGNNETTTTTVTKKSYKMDDFYMPVQFRPASRLIQLHSLCDVEYVLALQVMVKSKKETELEKKLTTLRKQEQEEEEEKAVVVPIIPEEPLPIATTVAMAKDQTTKTVKNKVATIERGKKKKKKTTLKNHSITTFFLKEDKQ